MWPAAAPCAFITSPACQRHITANATEELKLDGYRALATKTAGKVHLRSRNDNDFTTRYRDVAKALEALPSETIIDGEVVALVSMLGEPIRYSQELHADLSDLIEAVKAQGLEGIVGKRRSSRYEPGKRSGAWRKMRVNRGQDFVIGGYTVG
jgi:ATP-dependent DNA ligase